MTAFIPIAIRKLASLMTEAGFRALSVEADKVEFELKNRSGVIDMWGRVTWTDKEINRSAKSDRKQI